MAKKCVIFHEENGTFIVNPGNYELKCQVAEKGPPAADKRTLGSSSVASSSQALVEYSPSSNSSKSTIIQTSSTQTLTSTTYATTLRLERRKTNCRVIVQFPDTV